MTPYQIADTHLPQILLKLVGGGTPKPIGQPLSLALIREKIAAELTRCDQADPSSARQGAE
jgi:hypothetical protein